jgi:hypothetical protein
LLPPPFQWIEDLAHVLDSQRDARFVENIKAGTFDGAMLALLRRAVELERFPFARAGAAVRFECLAGALRRIVVAAKAGPLSALAKHAQDAQDVLAQQKKIRDDVVNETRSAPEPRKQVLERYLLAHAEGTQSLETLAGRLPTRCAAADEIAQALSRYDDSVFGPDAAGSYAPLEQKISRGVSVPEFERCHWEAQAQAHYLRATLLALEGLRRGDAPEDIRRTCAPPLQKARELAPSLQLELPVSRKIKAVFGR